MVQQRLGICEAKAVDKLYVCKDKDCILFSVVIFSSTKKREKN